MERDCSARMVKRQILKARGESGDSPIEQGNIKTFERKLTFNITHYPVIQNARSILQELQVLLASRNGIKLKDYLVMNNDGQRWTMLEAPNYV